MQYFWSFFAGGTLCVIAQILIDKTKLTPARILAGYVLTGAVLSSIGLYGPFADFAGAGASVPLTGFGHCLISGVKDAIREQGAIGILTGGLTGAAGGITAAMLFSVAAALIFDLKDK